MAIKEPKSSQPYKKYVGYWLNSPKVQQDGMKSQVVQT